MAGPLLYAPVTDLQAWMQGADSGTGTGTQLTTAQLTQSLVAATNRISMYSGQVWDSSTPAAVPPPSLHDLCLDLAAFYATTTYLKNKSMGADHPTLIRYRDAMQLLNDVRDGKIRLDPQPGGGVGAEPGYVINRIPRIFTGNDSNTRLDPMTGAIEASGPPSIFTPNWQDFTTGNAVDWGSDYLW